MKKEQPKMTIAWDVEYVKKNIPFDVFYSKCRLQYRKYFEDKTDDEIREEYEFITGKKVKTPKTTNKK